LKFLLVGVEEAPVKSVPNIAPVPFGVVAHFADVVGAADVGFGDDEATVGVLAHAVDVGNHDPVIAVDRYFHKPAVDLIGVDFTKEHKIAEDH